jgi:hypothetical protein
MPDILAGTAMPIIVDWLVDIVDWLVDSVLHPARTASIIKR